MQNFRTKAHSIDRWGKMAVAAMLSVAMAAVIFWGLTRTGNTDKTVAEMSIAQTIRASGDTLSASLDTDKFTGTSIRQTRILLEEEKGRADVSRRKRNRNSRHRTMRTRMSRSVFWVPQEETAL